MGYLDKIIGIIRGCGFGVALFTEATPTTTLANIFYEVGICQMLGKPVILAKTDAAETPSDFVRTEWVSQGKSAAEFDESLEQTLATLNALPDYFKAIAEVAMEADEIDYELAFERYKQAVLVGADAESVDRIRTVYEDLKQGPPNDSVRVLRRRLRTEVGHFLRMLPPSLQR